MVRNMNKSIIIALAVLVLPLPSAAINKLVADAGASFVAAVCVGGSYAVLKNASVKENSFPKFFIGASLIATGMSYTFLHSMTPAGRIKRANILLNELARHTLARTYFDNQQLFYDAIQDEFLREDLPLISAYNHLISLLPQIHCAFGLINKAAVEVGTVASLQEEYNSSLASANELFRNISLALKRIREHKDYLSQLTIYKESLNNAKQTIAQEQMAFAQLQMAQAQKSSTFLQWLKAVLLGR